MELHYICSLQMTMNVLKCIFSNKLSKIKTIIRYKHIIFRMSYNIIIRGHRGMVAVIRNYIQNECEIGGYKIYFFFLLKFFRF